MHEQEDVALNSGDRVKVSDIDWDTDGADPGELGLPAETTLTLPATWDEDDEIVDLLSDTHGYCIRGIGSVTKA